VAENARQQTIGKCNRGLLNLSPLEAGTHPTGTMLCPFSPAPTAHTSVVKCGGGGGGVLGGGVGGVVLFFVWSFEVLFLSCRVLCCCGVVLVVSCVVLFLLCVCVCDLFLFLHQRGLRVSLYKILFHFVASLWESIILSLPPHLQCLHYCNAMHDYCAIYEPLLRPLVRMPHTTQY